MRDEEREKECREIGAAIIVLTDLGRVEVCLLAPGCFMVETDRPPTPEETLRIGNGLPSKISIALNPPRFPVVAAAHGVINFETTRGLK